MQTTDTDCYHLGIRAGGNCIYIPISTNTFYPEGNSERICKNQQQWLYDAGEGARMETSTGRKTFHCRPFYIIHFYCEQCYYIIYEKIKQLFQEIESYDNYRSSTVPLKTVRSQVQLASFPFLAWLLDWAMRVKTEIKLIWRAHATKVVLHFLLAWMEERGLDMSSGG